MAELGWGSLSTQCSNKVEGVPSGHCFRIVWGICICNSVLFKSFFSLLFSTVRTILSGGQAPVWSKTLISFTTCELCSQCVSFLSLQRFAHLCSLKSQKYIYPGCISTSHFPVLGKHLDNESPKHDVLPAKALCPNLSNYSIYEVRL